MNGPSPEEQQRKRSFRKQWSEEDRKSEESRTKYEVRELLELPSLKWEETRFDLVPVNKTVRAVIEEVRQYGTFVGFVLEGGQDSLLRGFCNETTDQEKMSDLRNKQLAVKILEVNERTQRIHVSIEQADPRWTQSTAMKKSSKRNQNTTSKLF